MSATALLVIVGFTLEILGFGDKLNEYKGMWIIFLVVFFLDTLYSRRRRQ